MGTELLDHIQHSIQKAVNESIRQGMAAIEVKHIPVMRRSCIACMHFNEQHETCNKFNARPPARVIAFACPEYIEDSDIPF